MSNGFYYPGIPEAPSDGTTYGRKNKSWTAAGGSNKIASFNIPIPTNSIEITGFLLGHRHRIKGVIKNAGTNAIAVRVGTGSPVIWQNAANYQSRMWIYDAWLSNMSVDRCRVTYFATSNAENAGDYSLDMDLPNDPGSTIPTNNFEFLLQIARVTAAGGTGYSPIIIQGGYMGAITPIAVQFFTDAGTNDLTCDLTLYGDPS